jgi:GT2 family glycosyltransferase
VTPVCSIVIPVHGRAAVTRQCLDAVLALREEAPRFETVVVDDASTDRTGDVLADFGEAIRIVRRETNGGFATACNEGAARARGGYLVFLNNDTVPQSGWLAALVDHAEEHPEAAAVGAKLLYPGGAVQHAGVVIGQDGLPRHLYQGFPRDHPAVNRSRRFQAVTAACVLIRREPFEDAGGFDASYRNGLEDVDLCLRLGARGHEIHYCHEAVVVHYESATRGRHSEETDSALRLYRRRWGDRVQPDDVDYYVDDGLLRIGYDDSYPLRLTLAPELAVLDGERGTETERLLGAALRQVFELLRETIRLSVEGTEKHDPTERPLPRAEASAVDVLESARRLEIEIADLQQAVAELGGAPASPYLLYRKLSEEVRGAVERVTPAGSTILIVSRGDEELVELAGRRGRHFPQDDRGLYAGHYPASDEEAISHLEALRDSGAQYLVFPPTALWWLKHYGGFARHLADRYTLLPEETCAVYALEGGNGDGDH